VLREPIPRCLNLLADPLAIVSSIRFSVAPEAAFRVQQAILEQLRERGSAEGLARCPTAARRQIVPLEAVQRATEQVKAIVEASPDDDSAMNDALIRLAQRIDFYILWQLDELGVDEIDPKSARRDHAHASLARAQVTHKRWMVETREKLKAKVSAAEEKVVEVAKGALTHEAAVAIHNALLDISV
jgi:hypothetical protein